MAGLLPSEQLQQHAATLGMAPQPQLGQPGVQGVTMNGILPTEVAAPPVPLESALPGSKIAVFAPGFEYGERCTVIKMEPEWGPTHVPALHLINDETKERRLLPSTIQGARIEILISAEQLGIERAPENAIRARTRPLDLIALQWKGGAGGAAELMIWATGHLVFAYHEETDVEDEALEVTRLDQTEQDFLRPGDWLVKAPGGEFRTVRNDTFAQEYEEVVLGG